MGHLPEFVADYYDLAVDDEQVKAKIADFEQATPNTNQRPVVRSTQSPKKFAWHSLGIQSELSDHQQVFLTKVHGLSPAIVAELADRQLIVGG